MPTFAYCQKFMRTLELLEVSQKALLKYLRRKMIYLQAFGKKIIRLANAVTPMTFKSQQEWHKVAKLKSLLFSTRFRVELILSTLLKAVVYQSFRIIWLSQLLRPPLTKRYNTIHFTLFVVWQGLHARCNLFITNNWKSLPTTEKLSSFRISLFVERRWENFQERLSTERTDNVLKDWGSKF